MIIFYPGIVPSNLAQETLIPVTSTLELSSQSSHSSVRPSTPPILRRGNKSRRRRDSGNTSSEYSSIEVQIPSENVSLSK